jgi:hypothetical protein
MGFIGLLAFFKVDMPKVTSSADMTFAVSSTEFWFSFVWSRASLPLRRMLQPRRTSPKSAYLPLMQLAASVRMGSPETSEAFGQMTGLDR